MMSTSFPLSRLGGLALSATLLLAALSGTCHAAGCGLFRPGTSCVYGDGIPVPVRVDGTLRWQKVPDDHHLTLA